MGLNRIAVVSNLMPDAKPGRQIAGAIEPAVLSIVASFRRAGKGTRLVIGDGAANKIDNGLVRSMPELMLRMLHPVGAAAQPGNRAAWAMMGRRENEQGRLFYEFRLEDRIPESHLLRRVTIANSGVRVSVSSTHHE